MAPILPRGFTPKLGDRSILRTTGGIGNKPHIFAGAFGQRDEGGLEIDLIQSLGVSGRETPLPCHPPSELASVREGREERAGRARNEKMKRVCTFRSSFDQLLGLNRIPHPFCFPHSCLVSDDEETRLQESQGKRSSICSNRIRKTAFGCAAGQATLPSQIPSITPDRCVSC